MRANLAPPGQPGWSGQNWYETSGRAHATIAVIERPAPSYDQYAERKAREAKAKRVPFGFARALEAESEVPA